MSDPTYHYDGMDEPCMNCDDDDRCFVDLYPDRTLTAALGPGYYTGMHRIIGTNGLSYDYTVTL